MSESGTGQVKSSSSGEFWNKTLLVALLTGVVLPIWLPGPFPTFDGPQHVLAGYLLNHIHDAGMGYDRYLELQLSVTSFFFPVVTALFEKLLPIRMAAKCALSMLVLLQATGLLALMSATVGRRSPWRWIVLIFPFSAVFYFGVHNYSFAIGFGLWALAVFVSTLRAEMGQLAGRPTRWKTLTLLLSLTALAHAFCATLLGFVMGILVLGLFGRLRLLRTLFRLFLASIPTLAVIVLVSVLAAGAQQTPVWRELRLDFAALAWLPRNLFETPYETLWTGNAIVLMAIGFALWAAARKEPIAKASLLALLSIVLVMLFVPDNIDAWMKLRVRFPSWIMILALMGAAIPTGMKKHLVTLLSVSVAVLSVSSYVLVLRANFELASMQAVFESGIGCRDEVTFRRLYIRPSPDRISVPGGNMAHHLNLYYMMDEGGVFPNVYKDRQEQHFLRSTELWQELEPQNVPGIENLPDEIVWQIQARLGMQYEDVLLWDATSGQMSAFESTGYDLLFQEGSLLRLAPPNRTVSLTVEGAPGLHLSAFILYGDLLWPHASVRLEPVAQEAGFYRGRMDRLPATLVDLVVNTMPGPGVSESLYSLPVDLTSGDADLSVSVGQ